MSSVAGWLRGRRLVVGLPLLAVIAIGATLGVARLRSSSASPTPPTDAVILVVGRDSVHQSLFDARLQATLTAAEQGGAPQQGSAQYPAFLGELRARVLKSLIFDTVVAQEAGLRGVEASDADIDAEITVEEGNAGGAGQLDRQLAEAGGSRAQLRDLVRSRLNESRLEQLLAAERAGDALRQLSAGAVFADLARQLSDDDTSRAQGGALGELSLDQLKAGDQAFLSAVTALKTGETTAQPVRDAAGFEILRLDAATRTSVTLHRILVAAPQPYTVRERPAWFTEAVLLAIADDCAGGQLRVLINAGVQPCTAESSPTPAATGNGFSPRSGPTGSPPPPATPG